MDLELTDDAELFLDTTDRFLARTLPTSTLRTMIDDGIGVDRGLWSSGAELGWTSMLVPEQYGGGSISGDGVRDLGIVAEVLGRSLVPGPVLTTNIVALAVARAGSTELADQHLPALATGAEIATWAVFDDPRSPGPATSLTSDGTGLTLTGTKLLVQDAHVADHLLVVAPSPSGTTQVLLPIDTPGISVGVLDGLDLTRRYCRVGFERVPVPATWVVGDAGGAGGDVGLQLSLAVALQCAETVGATDRVYDMTLEYVKDRKAFGRPIGSYQALKHRLADMLLWLESAKAVTVAAVEAVQREVDGATPPGSAAEATSLAKAYVGDRCPAIVRDCFQMHGGIACTWEHDLHLFMRRVDTNTALYGDVDHHRDLLGPCGGLLMTTEDLMGADATTDERAESEELHEYRRAARSWLAEHLDGVEAPVLDDEPSPERLAELQALQAELHAAGYVGFTFPIEYGGQGLTPEHEAVFVEEAAPYSVPIRFFAVSINIIGATLLACASHEQKLRYLPKILIGEEVWLQFLSEPSGGSDLAGLLTSAVRDGDTFILNGQKTWSTGAHLCDFALCPVRTAWDRPKHKGISNLIVDLRTPGIDVRRIRQINGEAEFCEEFLTDVAVPAENLIGPENEGWRGMRIMLEIEHAWIGRGGSGRIKRIDANSTIDYIVDLAKAKGKDDDPGVRRQLVALHVALEAHKLVAARISRAVDAGKLPHGYGSLLKLGNDTLVKRRAEEALALAHDDGITWSAGGESAWAHEYLSSRAASIAGGSDEILRNNVSERVLGLPREVSPDRDVPFNQVPHN